MFVGWWHGPISVAPPRLELLAPPRIWGRGTRNAGPPILQRPASSGRSRLQQPALSVAHAGGKRERGAPPLGRHLLPRLPQDVDELLVVVLAHEIRVLELEEDHADRVLE